MQHTQTVQSQERPQSIVYLMIMTR